MITVAMAKGRTADDVFPLWASAGLPIPSDLDDSRALVFEVTAPHFGTMRFLLAKPADVPTYVSFGVADMGVVGKDVLLESRRDVYELLDLQAARCTLCVAGELHERNRRPRRVATKYPGLAEQYFRSRGQVVEIIPLSGSIELAAVIHLTDRIFDLVQTGSTLKANGLEVFDAVYQVSARLIANQSSYRTKRAEVLRVVTAIQKCLQGEETSPCSSR